jgi:hypothetical protein
MAFDYAPTTSRLSIKGASQIELEMLYSKYQTLDALRQDFAQSGAKEQLAHCGIPEDFGLDLLAQLVLHKRADIPTLVGILRPHFEEEESPAQACADMIHKCCAEDVCDWDPLAQQIVIRHDIEDDLRERIDLFQYPLPMIEEPREVTHNRQTGYRTIKRSILLKNNHHDEDVCLDHINRLNRQKLALNHDVVAFVQNAWKNLDRKKPDETEEEFFKRKKAFEKYDRVTRDVLDTLALEGDGFWLTHAYDKRGRTYVRGYAVNYQGNDCVQFAKAEKLNEE